jgi:hypothetical protein
MTRNTATDTTDNGTCEQRIRPYYASRMETIGALVRLSEERASYADMANLEEYADPDGMIDAQERIWEMPLSVEIVRTVKILLGTGGPGDWFEAQVDADGAIGRIEYHFNDWFDHAAINVSDDDDARAFCEQFTEGALLREENAS